MTVACSSPDPAAGVAVQLTGFLDCQARALGENGFQAVAGGLLGMSLLSGLLTIFIAFIGYRLILGESPGVRDGVGWAVRVGLVLALVTSWPAFQTLIFNVVVDGPGELASVVLPASGLPSEGLEWRVQQAYDVIRLGPAFDQGPNPTTAAPAQFQSAMPQTASLFVLSTSGFVGAFRIAVGFLLALAPLAILCILFDATLTIFATWLRALTGMALAALAATIVTAIDLAVVESQLAYLQAMRRGGDFRNVDLQALPTIVITFAAIMLVTAIAATRMMGAFRLSVPRFAQLSGDERRAVPVVHGTQFWLQAGQEVVGVRPAALPQGRAAAVAESLAATTRREQTYLVDSRTTNPESSYGHRQAGSSSLETGLPRGLGSSGRRTAGRRTRSAIRRDKSR